MQFLRRHPILAIAIIAAVGTAAYSVVTRVSFCATDLEVRYPFQNSGWVIRELGRNCSALNGQLEISAVNKASGRTVPLFFIDGDASTALTFGKGEVVLLVDRFADIKQQGKSFGGYLAKYRRATDAELNAAPRLRPEN
jgi:hypothetical protein